MRISIATGLKVKDDVLSMFRWVVETQDGKIVAGAKVQNDPDGGKDIAEKMVLKELVKGKTPQEIEKHKYFQNLVLSLRDVDSGNPIRVYDVTNITDLIDPKAIFTPVTKDMLLKGPFGSSGGMNLEGLALGPELPAEKGTRAWSLIAVVDSGGPLEPFSDNRLAAFKLVKTIPEPPTIFLSGLGLGWLTIRRYRNSP